jgi:SAM-dependent methyltransferase
MKSYWSLGHRLPHFLASPLFGNRRRFGLEIQHNDPEWSAWQKFYMDFYQNTQKQGIGKVVNDLGYQILKLVDLSGKHVLEVGPGTLPHLRFWKGVPLHYTLMDNQQVLLDHSAKILEAQNVKYSCHLTDSHILPLNDQQADVVISFYSLEHLNPLDLYLQEIKRILRPGGIFIGAIPAEGGIAWGLGRFLTSRQYVRKHTSINLDKIICWEHPNFAEDILKKLDANFIPVSKKYSPFLLPLIDVNLIISFIYRRGNV